MDGQRVEQAQTRFIGAVCVHRAFAWLILSVSNTETMSLRPAIRTHLLRRIEIYVLGLTLAFVSVAAAMVWVDVPAAAAFLATVVGMGVIQGAIQWADRAREKTLRQQAIFEIREMLRDQVLNQLAAMKMWVAENPDPETVDLLFTEVDEAIDELARLIDRLTEEQLNTWKLTYANAADHVAFARTAGA